MPLVKISGSPSFSAASPALAARRPFPRLRRSLSPLLVGLLVGNSFLPAWADYRLSDSSPEQEIGLIEPPALPETPAPEEAFHFDQERWNRAREAVEKGRDPGEEAPPPAAAVSPEPVQPPVPEPGFAVELPYESGLSISGRKLIALKLKETRRKSAKRAKELGVQQKQRDFEMKQELQVRIKGKVGRKITVNVDFDDTKEDKRDISVVYQGDPEEVVQEAAFGDITLSLPSTEFVSYSKQLFGIRTRLKYKRAELMAIGSRTKGVTETKRFNGNTQFERKEISDTSYIRRRYYQMAFDGSHLPLQAGTEEVWIDDRVGTNDTPSTRQDMTVEDFAAPSSAYTGDFDLLKPGQDYTVDYGRGIINFRSPQAQNAVIAVDYTLADGRKLSELGTAGRLKLIKTENDLPLVTASSGTEVGYRRELKTFYSIGRNKIVRDNGRGNFILRTIDLNRNDTAVTLTDGSTLRYPDNLEVDPDVGTFNIAPPLRAADNELYAPTPAHKFTFLLEYRYRLRSYLIKPNIVLGSERVLLNGRLLTRDVDYFIDYDSGFLTFFKEDEIDETTQIEVTYEFAPFGGQLGQTLVGARTEFTPVPNKLFLGSTLLYTFAPKPALLPEVRSTPSSLLVYEADGRVDSVQVPLVPLTMSLSGEVARSVENPNLFGKALVDSMEGIKQEEQAIMDVDFWAHGANPTGGGITRPAALAVSDEELSLNDINPQSQAREGETQKVLGMQYGLASLPGNPSQPEQASLVQPLSVAGRDFSKKLFMEVWIQGAGDAGQGMDMIVDAGQFNEDADGDGNLDTEDLNSDGNLNTGEDEGWNYNDPGPDGLRGTGDDSQVRVGAGNGRIDTEDLDADGTKDFSDLTPRAFPLFRLSDAPTSSDIKMIDPQNRREDPRGDLGFTGWRFIQVPLNISAAEETNFQAVKQVRVTLIGQNRSGFIRLGKVSFVGNRWERAVTVGGSSMTVTAINNIDDPSYRSLAGNPDFDDLYKDQTGDRRREQALDLLFDLPAGSTASTKVVYNPARDFSKHKRFRFFVQAPETAAVGETLFVQLGSETDYFEYSVPIGPEHQGTWVLEGADLVDRNDDGIPDELRPLRATAGRRVAGSPSFTNVGQIKIGVRNGTGAPISSELWVNEIHLDKERKKRGNARRFGADFTWANWGSFGGKFREVDRNFQTLTSAITNQDKTEESGYLNFNRLQMLPLSFSGSRSETVTPAAVRTGESGLVSVLEEGRVESRTGSGRGELVLPFLPRLGFGYDKSITESTLLRRTDDKDTYSGSLDYSTPWRLDLLPGRFFAFRPLPESVSLTYRRTNYFLSFFPEKKLEELAVSTASLQDQRNAIFSNVRTLEITDDWGGRASFTPWDGFNIGPSYSLKKVREQRRFTRDDLALAPDFEKTRDYDKSLSQTVGLTASWRLLRWLEPRLSYTNAGTETNNLPTVSSPTAFDFKTVDRSGDGEASWTFAARELLPNFRPTQSFSVNNSFRMQDGDTYENVEREFTDWRRIEVVQIKRFKRADGRPLYVLLPPLTPRNKNVRRKQLTLRNTLRSSGNWSPLDWISPPRFLQPVKTFTLTATVTNTDEHTETTDTLRDSVTRIWPDLIFSLRDTEKFFFLHRWMGNSQVNLRTNRKETEMFKVQFTEEESLGGDYRFTLWRRFDFFLSYGRNNNLDRDLRTDLLNKEGEGFSHSGQVGMTFGAWRFTPSASFKTDRARDGAGKSLQDLTTHAYGLKTRFDKAYPKGFRFPFTRKVFGNINRFLLDSGLTYEHKKSTLNVERDNTDVYTASVTGEYEISQNFRLSFGGGSSVVKNREKRDENLITIEINSSLVIQF